ncbi:WXG100 family type VII secretion target [Nocardia sp. NPDC058058]|uniref:WXG100 family type VII secretion target n=1 Tax=Nocardia sp. NPDC058058 TaxID=3346317 RepID=UPI0036DF6512
MTVSQNSAVAKAAQNHMSDVVSTVKAILDRVTKDVDDSRVGFKGTAAVAFNAAANDWHTEADKLRGILHDIETQVGTGVATFQNLDSENESGFKTLSTGGSHTNLV